MSTRLPDSRATRPVRLGAALMLAALAVPGLAGGATALSCTIRYQVHHTWDGNGVPGVYSGARFTDNGIYSEVRTLATLSSNSYFIEVDLVRTVSPSGAIRGLPVLGQLRLLRCQ